MVEGAGELCGIFLQEHESDRGDSILMTLSKPDYLPETPPTNNITFGH